MKCYLFNPAAFHIKFIEGHFYLIVPYFFLNLEKLHSSSSL